MDNALIFGILISVLLLCGIVIQVVALVSFGRRFDALKQELEELPAEFDKLGRKVLHDYKSWLDNDSTAQARLDRSDAERQERREAYNEDQDNEYLELQWLNSEVEWWSLRQDIKRFEIDFLGEAATELDRAEMDSLEKAGQSTWKRRDEIDDRLPDYFLY